MDSELHEGLKAIKDRDGVSEAEQMRHGIKLWIDSKGYKLKARKGGKTKRQARGSGTPPCVNRMTPLTANQWSLADGCQGSYTRRPLAFALASQTRDRRAI